MEQTVEGAEPDERAVLADLNDDTFDNLSVLGDVGEPSVLDGLVHRTVAVYDKSQSFCPDIVYEDGETAVLFHFPFELFVGHLADDGVDVLSEFGGRDANLTLGFSYHVH